MAQIKMFIVIGKCAIQLNGVIEVIIEPDHYLKVDVGQDP